MQRPHARMGIPGTLGAVAIKDFGQAACVVG